MATNKTINPTNVTVQIPEMTDKPNQSANSNCLDKIIDGVNALNSNIESIGKIAKLETSNVTSFTLNTTSGDVHLIVIGTNNGSGAYIGIVSTSSVGSFSIFEINKGSAITIDTSDANKFKVTSSLSARKYYIYDFCLNGNNVTL